MDAGGSAGDEAERLRRRAEEYERRAQAARRRAAAFDSGQRGEEAVARVLDSLAPAGYRHIDDVSFPNSKRANIDHVLVGPAGVFVIDAKNWGGHVEVRDGVLRQSGYRRTDKLETIVAGTRAIEARAGLPERSIYPVACLTGSATVPATLVGDCTVVSLSELADGLRATPVRLTPEQVSWAYQRLDVVLERKAELKAAPMPPIVRRAAANARAGRPADPLPMPAPVRRRPPPRPSRSSSRSRPPLARSPRSHAPSASARARRAVTSGATDLGNTLLRAIIGIVAVLVMLAALQHYMTSAAKAIPKPPATSTPVHSSNR